jgi:hypothetical protein
LIGQDIDALAKSKQALIDVDTLQEAFTLILPSFFITGQINQE